jgi:hypothetical protein
MTNAFTQLTRLIPQPKLAVGTVSAVHTDGTVTVTAPGGDATRVRSSVAVSAGDRVFVRNGVVEGEAPALTTASISAG